MSTAPVPNQVWGERTYLLPKRLGYVFSIDLYFRLRPERIHWVGPELCVRLELEGVVSTTHPSTYHVLDSSLVTSAAGTVEDVPRLWATRGADWLRLRNNGTAVLDGLIILDAEPRASDGTASLVDIRRVPSRIALGYCGVLKMPTLGGLFLNDEGDANAGKQPPPPDAYQGRPTASVAMRFESGHPRYRWLMTAQYLGFGTVSDPSERQRGERKPPYPLVKDGLGSYRRLLFSYDVHSAI